MTTFENQPTGARLRIPHVESKKAILGGVTRPGSAEGKPRDDEMMALGRGTKDQDSKVFERKAGAKAPISNLGGVKEKCSAKTDTIGREIDVLGVLVETARRSSAFGQNLS